MSPSSGRPDVRRTFVTLPGTPVDDATVSTERLTTASSSWLHVPGGQETPPHRCSTETEVAGHGAAGSGAARTRPAMVGCPARWAGAAPGDVDLITSGCPRSGHAIMGRVRLGRGASNVATEMSPSRHHEGSW